MNVNYERSFLRDLEKVKNRKLLFRLSVIIEMVKSAGSLNDLNHVKKIKGHPHAFRIRLDDFRIGFFLEKDTVIFTRFLNRKDLYRHFP